MKKFIRRHGLSILLYGVIFIIFAFGFLVGAITHNAFDNKPVVSDVEAATHEKRTETLTPEYIEMTVTATAYCPCKKCSDNWGDLTATGIRAKEGRTIAVDPSVIPYGSKVIIDGFDEVYTAEDCGAAVKGNAVDIFFDTHEEAKQFGKQQLVVKVVKK